MWCVYVNLFLVGFKDRVLRNMVCSLREMGIKSEGVLRGDWWKIIILFVWIKLYWRLVFDKSVLLFGLMINGLYYWIWNIKLVRLIVIRMLVVKEYNIMIFCRFDLILKLKYFLKVYVCLKIYVEWLWCFW